MRIEIRCQGPLDVAATLERFQLWGEDPANQFGEGVFRRVLRHHGRLVPYEVRWSGPVDAVRLEVRAAEADATVRDALTREVRRIFGLDFDLPAFYRVAERDGVLSKLVTPLYGLRPTLNPNPFEMLVGAITAQQVNLTFASTCRARLVRSYGTAVALDGGTVHAFPEPEALAAVPLDDLRALQYSTRKAEYIRDLARGIHAGEIDLEALAGVSNDEVVTRITALRGLGRWTAEWFLARWAGRGDVFAAGDLAVIKAFRHAFGGHLDETAVREQAAGWGAHQNVAVHYLLSGMRRDLVPAQEASA